MKQLQWTNDHEEADSKMFVLVKHILDKLLLKPGTGEKKRYVAIHKRPITLEVQCSNL